jgi:hypothetical protein
MPSVNNGREWTILEDFPNNNIVRGLLNPVLEVINAEKSHDDVMARFINLHITMETTIPGQFPSSKRMHLWNH